MCLNNIVIFYLILVHTAGISRKILSLLNHIPHHLTRLVRWRVLHPNAVLQLPPTPERDAGGSRCGTCWARAEPSCPADLASLLTPSPSPRGTACRRRHCFSLAVGLQCPESLVQRKNPEDPFPCSGKCPFLWSKSKRWSLRRNS